jgi:hypothetical protein
MLFKSFPVIPGNHLNNFQYLMGDIKGNSSHEKTSCIYIGSKFNTG